MSNTCNCPSPPGGTIECADDQLAVCGYQNGQIISGCYGRPSHVFGIRDESTKQLALANWIISTVTQFNRSDSDPIEAIYLAMLSIGQYENQTGEMVAFKTPNDFRVAHIFIEQGRRDASDKAAKG
jgi:hypothetical protein